jgi:hypothetical protein
VARPDERRADHYRRPSATYRGSSSDLSTYVPRPEKPWDARRASHLLRRTGFAPTWAQIAGVMGSSPAEVVATLLEPLPLPQAPGSWVTQAPFVPITNEAQAQYARWAREMQEWWFGLMLEPARALHEKMVLFWHNHFVS